MKKILLIATGGTISCDQGEQGMRPAISSEGLKKFITVRDVNVDTIQLMNVDSAQMGPVQWLATAQAVGASYADYHGFVVTHGTDTLSHAGAFLSAMLINLAKPVVITGAQVPLSVEGSDGVINLNDAVSVAVQGRGGVFGAFGGRIFDGACMRKVDAVMRDAFACTAGEPLGEVTNGVVTWFCAEKPSSGDFSVVSAICADVAVLRVFPGLSAKRIHAFADGLKGLVVEAYGIGAMSEIAANALIELAAGGLQIVIVSQIKRAHTNLNQYEITSGLSLAANIREGGGASVEQALAGLAVGLADKPNNKGVLIYD